MLILDWPTVFIHSLGDSFGRKKYTLYLIPEFQKEFNKNPRLKNKFGWVDQPEYIENRRKRFRILSDLKSDIKLTYSYLWAQNISEQLGASRVDVNALAYGSALDTPIVTDDFDMIELADQFSIEVWGILDLLEIMNKNNRAGKEQIKALISYLEYINDFPYPSFKRKAIKKFGLKM